MAKHKAIRGPIKVGDTGKFGKYSENDNFARIANMAKHKATPTFMGPLIALCFSLLAIVAILSFCHIC